LLHPHQSDVFEVYLKMYFGDPDVPLSNYNLKSVTDILAKHPELKKIPFPEYTIRHIEKIYSIPENLSKFINSQIITSAQVRNNIFQIEANLGYWKKILDYKDPEMPAALVNMQKSLHKNSSQIEKQTYRDAKSKYEQQLKNRFEKYLNKMINTSNREILAELKNEHTHFKAKAKALFMSLQYIESWMQKKGKNTKEIRQAMVDLVNTIGFTNPAIQVLLKSPNALEKIEGFRKILDERNQFASELGYKQQFNELMLSLKIEFPTGFSKNENPESLLRNLENEVLKSNFTIKENGSLRVRSLSIQEAPFRSCLGKDCSTRNYFSTALDPNFIYFTMTDKNFKSSGHITVVLGTAKDSTTNEVRQIAFVDKIQNIPNQKMQSFLNAVSNSLKEKGYDLAFPVKLGDENGITNEKATREFIQRDILLHLESEVSNFSPHEHQYNFEKGYSRAYDKLNLKLYSPIELHSQIEIARGKERSSHFIDKNIDQQKLILEFLQLKDSKNPEDILKYISSPDFVKDLDRLGLYKVSDYSKELSRIQNSHFDFKIQKLALYTNSYVTNDIGKLIHWLNTQPDTIQQHLISEVQSFNTTQNKVKKFIFSEMILPKIAELNAQNLVLTYLKHPYTDINEANNNGLTALMYYTQKNETHLLSKILQHPKLKINQKDRFGETALLKSTLYGSLDSMKILLNHRDIDVNTQDYNNQTPLIRASERGHLEAFQLLLKQPNINLNLQNMNKQTALMSAVVNSKTDIAKELLKTDADPNIMDNNGQSPLHMSVERNNEDLVEAIVQNKLTNINIKNRYGKTALERAQQKENLNIINILKKYGALE
ncbi:MAG: ankyrin repeat domain-containing protein, partial [Pseudobdellovibrio sp.]